VLVGTSFYLGDLNSMPFQNVNPQGDFVFKFASGLVYRYNFTPRIALKVNILFGEIAASDSNNRSIAYNTINGKKVHKWDYEDRGLSFSSPISEISAQLEINFFNIYTAGHKNQISPYLFGGGAIFSFNPQAVSTVDGKPYDLQPIGTEGQGRTITDKNGNSKKMPEKYPLTGFAIPFGIGFKANIGRYICIGAEWGLRFTFTNYLDDVGGLYFEFTNAMEPDPVIRTIKQRFADPSGNHTPDSQRYSTIKKDWYSFAGVIITVRIGNEDRFCDVRTNVNLKNKQGRKR